MENRDDFFNKVSEFFDAGVINEVYGNEKICLLNVGNSLYVGTNYYKGKGNGNYMGIILDIDQMKKAVENNDYISQFMAGASKNVLKQVIMEFNDRTLEVMKNIKARTDREGPSEYINFDFEEELSRIMKSK